MIDWNRPLVADVGEPLKVQGPVHDVNYLVEIHAGDVRLYNNNGELYYRSSKDDSHKYTLRNRPWRVGDPVVLLHSGKEGVVNRIYSDPRNAFPILVRFDAGDTSCMVANWIRYDYSRAREPKDHLHGHDFTPTYHLRWSDGTTANKKNHHAELEAMIADALETHEASKRTGDDALADDIAAHLYAYRGNRDGPTMPVARSIIAMVREHGAAKPDTGHFPDIKKMVSAEVENAPALDPDPDVLFPVRCTVDAIEMFAEQRERAVAKARREALEEAAQIADEKHREQCGCWCVGAAIRDLINKDSSDD